MNRTAREEERQRWLANVAIVLMEPKYAENIGAAARCAMNMGISRLIVVRDEEPDREKMLMMATHKAAHLIDHMELHRDLATALLPFAMVVGTTAREGRHRHAARSPREVVAEVLPLLAENQVAFLFGPEHRGLTNDDLKYCQLRSNIPTADFSSLNLAQAVAIHCYELYHTLLEAEGVSRHKPKMASSFELEGMYHHVEELLKTIDFLKHGDYDYWMNNIRHFLGRMELRSKETQMVRGFCRQFLWYDGQRQGGGDASGALPAGDEAGTPAGR
ncbi:MAG: RNA methyltransferase [Desulfobulbaceae bacterium]|nr:RNA methyltransferase [Desulfobulbaceae bacterium]